VERETVGRALAVAVLLGFLALFAVLLVDTFRSGDEPAAVAAETLPEEVWADAFCTEVSEWREAIEDLVSEVGARDLLLAGDSTVRNLLLDGADLTGELIGDLRRLGLPDSDGVEAVRGEWDAFLDELDELRAAVASGASRIEGPLDLVRVGSHVLREVRDAAGDAWAAFDALRREGVFGELRQAMAESSVCRTLDDGLPF
jgi:hypothetical protein